jgi:penicillin-binding protein 1B
VAGKTGTTNDLRDSWFAGFSGNRVAVVWVGKDDNQPSHFSGATAALPIWSRIIRDSDPQDYAPAVPEEIEFFPFDAEDNEHDDEDCDQISQVPFQRGSLPDEFIPCGGRKDAMDRLVDELLGHDRDDERSEQTPQRKKKSNWFWDLFN